MQDRNKLHKQSEISNQTESIREKLIFHTKKQLNTKRYSQLNAEAEGPNSQ